MPETQTSEAPQDEPNKETAAKKEMDEKAKELQRELDGEPTATADPIADPEPEVSKDTGGEEMAGDPFEEVDDTPMDLNEARRIRKTTAADLREAETLLQLCHEAHRDACELVGQYEKPLSLKDLLAIQRVHTRKEDIRRIQQREQLKLMGPAMGPRKTRGLVASAR